MSEREKIELKRECELIQIPSGNKVKLPAGTALTIMQSLGGSYTVMTDEGFLLRVQAEDVDAIGKEAKEAVSVQETSDIPFEKKVWDQLRTCYDPEIPVNIAELGLIYACNITDLTEGGKKVEIQMTLTAPGCGMGETIRNEVQSKVSRLAEAQEVHVELVWSPAWTPEKMTEAAKLQLGML